MTSFCRAGGSSKVLGFPAVLSIPHEDTCRAPRRGSDVTTMFPDIIVRERKTDKNNPLVIEVRSRIALSMKSKVRRPAYFSPRPVLGFELRLSRNLTKSALPNSSQSEDLRLPQGLPTLLVLRLYHKYDNCECYYTTYELTRLRALLDDRTKDRSKHPISLLSLL